jgi:hypothetical protein
MTMTMIRPTRSYSNEVQLEPEANVHEEIRLRKDNGDKLRLRSTVVAAAALPFAIVVLAAKSQSTNGQYAETDYVTLRDNKTRGRPPWYGAIG